MAYQRWVVSTEDLESIDAVRARDLVIRCFFEAQKETFSASRRQVGLESDDETLQRDVTNAVRAACRETGADFDHPTPETLADVVQVLARKAAAAVGVLEDKRNTIRRPRRPGSRPRESWRPWTRRRLPRGCPRPGPGGGGCRGPGTL